MGNKNVGLEADVVVAGSGPGGATVARELSRRGKKVILCEAGPYQKGLGRIWNMPSMMEGKGMRFSKEGNLVVIPRTVGGASLFFSATAWKPPAWLKDRYGIDLSAELKEMYEEVPIGPVPESHFGAGPTAIMQAARDLGLPWHRIDKWIRFDKCVKNKCGAACVLGCRYGAKFNAREYVDQAVTRGTRLLTKTEVYKVLTESGRAVGVRAKGPDGWLDIKASTVVISAGGKGTPLIMQHSGIHEAGDGMFVDPLVNVWGIHPKHGTLFDVPMFAGTHFEKEGILMTDAGAPTLFWVGLMALTAFKGWPFIRHAIHSNRIMGIMAKVRDDVGGRVNEDGSFSKPLSPHVWKALNKGANVAKDILMKAGVRPENLVTNAVIAAHPGGTMRIDNLLDRDCQTQIKNCYCMDASIIPEDWGLPPTLTLFSMAKRLARHLVGPDENKR